MPIYEYVCKACGHELEVIQKMSDPALKKCPECQKSKLQKLVSASRFQLKGTGWYETDFKDKPAKSSKKSKDSSKSTQSSKKDKD